MVTQEVNFMNEQVLFYNGDILTMSDETCEAVLIENGKIKEVGSYDSLKTLANEACISYDLKGQCLMPSFIDAHSHLLQFANTLKFVPLSGATSVKDIQKRFATYLKEHKKGEHEWLMGFGYDHNALAEHRHPTRQELDEISTTNPIIIAHASFHIGVLNTLALKEYNLSDDVKDPEGGSYGRDEFGHLNGYMEEIAFMRGPAERVMSLKDIDEYAYKAQQIYASYGITTTQEGFAHESEVSIYENLGKKNKMLLDVVAYVDIVNDREVVRKRKDLQAYKEHFRIGGYKLFLDGSPQGKTAWMSKPYENSGDYCGYPTYEDKDVDTYIQTALDDDKQLLVHCNGDAASQQMLNAFHHSRQKQTDTRPVMVHCQTLRPDQLPQLTQIGILPTFFVAHVYHWGDVHLVNFGKERAENISCTKSALDEGLSITFHQDTPVIMPDMLESIWVATNRITKNGVVLGAHQCISVMEALKAVTINAAYQYFEENQKGSIEKGKLADLIILDKNPLKIDKMTIKDIQILKTFKEGNVIFEK